MRKLKAPRLTVKAKTGLVLLFIILLTSVLAPVLAPYDPLVSNLSEALQKPSAAHLLGTDNIGRDTLSRVLYGGRQSKNKAEQHGEHRRSQCEKNGLSSAVEDTAQGVPADISAAGSTESSRRSPASSRDFRV